MYAIIADGGRQYRVEPGQQLDLDYREAGVGERVTFDRVLLVADDHGVRVGQPVLDGASVTAQVVEVRQGKKIVVRKFKRRKTYRRKAGHRSLYTRVEIGQIELPGGETGPAEQPASEQPASEQA